MARLENRRTSPFIHRVLSIIPAIFVVTLLSACGGEDKGLEPTFANVVEHVLPSCTVGCHSSEYDDGNLLLLTADVAREQLVNVRVESPNWEGSPWDGFLRVKPGDPDNSALVIVLEQPLGLHPDLAMPPGATISSAEKQLVRDWIAAGAPAE